jgi:hypothetical protein
MSTDAIMALTCGNSSSVLMRQSPDIACSRAMQAAITTTSPTCP